MTEDDPHDDVPTDPIPTLDHGTERLAVRTGNRTDGTKIVVEGLESENDIQALAPKG